MFVKVTIRPGSSNCVRFLPLFIYKSSTNQPSSNSSADMLHRWKIQVQHVTVIVPCIEASARFLKRGSALKKASPDWWEATTMLLFSWKANTPGPSCLGVLAWTTPALLRGLQPGHSDRMVQAVSPRVHSGCTWSDSPFCMLVFRSLCKSPNDASFYFAPNGSGGL